MNNISGSVLSVGNFNSSKISYRGCRISSCGEVSTNSPSDYAMPHPVFKFYFKKYQELTSTDPRVRSELLAILRRARKRLKKVGFRVTHSRDGSLKIRLRRPQKKDVDQETVIAKQVAAFVKKEQLGYGCEVISEPSWSIALCTHQINECTSDFLESILPKAISEFAHFARETIRCDLSNETYQRRGVLTGVPDEVADLWRSELAMRNEIPFCFRPDCIVLPDGSVKIVEFNVDTRLDRGVAEGVTEYSKPLIKSGYSAVGFGLVEAHVQEIQRTASRPTIFAATIVNKDWRGEYILEETYFCRKICESEKATWVVRDFRDVYFDVAESCLIDRLTSRKIDVVRLEFDLIGAPTEARHEEIDFAKKVLHLEQTRLFGSLLPYADKILLARVMESSTTSKLLKSVLCPTQELNTSPNLLNEKSQFGMHYVLKRCGVFAQTTGSKGVIISSDVSPETWDKAISIAINDIKLGLCSWVLQPRLQPELLVVQFRKRKKQKTRQVHCFARLSAFFTRMRDVSCPDSSNQSYELARAICTAGTDSETLNKRRFCIRGLRESTYLAVTAKSGSKKKASLKKDHDVDPYNRQRLELDIKILDFDEPTDKKLSGEIEKLFDSFYYRYHFKRKLFETKRLRLAALDAQGQLQGFGTIEKLGPFAILSNLLVSAEFQGRGVGKLLETKRMDIVRSLQLSPYSSCVTKGLGSQRLKLSHGMQPINFKIGNRQRVFTPDDISSAVSYVDMPRLPEPVNCNDLTFDEENNRTRLICVTKDHLNKEVSSIQSLKDGYAELLLHPEIVAPECFIYQGFDFDFGQMRWGTLWQLDNDVRSRGLTGSLDLLIGMAETIEKTRERIKVEGYELE